jgi:hypothetical protein
MTRRAVALYLPDAVNIKVSGATLAKRILHVCLLPCVEPGVVESVRVDSVVNASKHRFEASVKVFVEHAHLVVD